MPRAHENHTVARLLYLDLGLWSNHKPLLFILFCTHLWILSACYFLFIKVKYVHNLKNQLVLQSLQRQMSVSNCFSPYPLSQKHLLWTFKATLLILPPNLCHTLVIFLLAFFRFRYYLWTSCHEDEDLNILSPPLFPNPVINTSLLFIFLIEIYGNFNSLNVQG